MEVPSTHSDRQYKSLTLDNGVSCTLIVDPTSETSGVSVSVQCGQLNDSTETPGLAHLTEHLLFMGSKPFPNENEYDEYVQRHGGHSNAYTDLEATVFYVSVLPDYLPGACARLVAALSEPLLHTSSVARELQAVDSEHANNKQQDHWRLHQLARTLWGNTNGSSTTTTTPSTSHVYGQFGTGNQQSLGDNYELLQRNVRQFFETHYIGANMSVCILGCDTMEHLEAMVVQLFSQIPQHHNQHQSPPPPAAPAPPLPTISSQVIHWTPVRADSHTLELQWHIPPQRALYKSKPASVWSHVLGHEGPGSLLYTLRNLQYAQDLSADSVSTNCRTFSIFKLQVELTQLGFNEVTAIFKMIFWYIRKCCADTIPKWVYQELQTTADTQFRFLSKQDAAHTCSDIASHMDQFAPEHYLSGNYKLYEYNPEAIVQVGQCLSQMDQNLLVLIGSPSFDTDQTDPWYGTPYRIVPKDHPDHVLSRLENLGDFSHSLKWPAPNDMLPTNFDLLPQASIQDDPPRVIVDSPRLRLWHKADTHYSSPKVNVLALLRSVTIQSPQASVLSTLWCQVVTELCNDFSYNASMAGLHCGVSDSTKGMELQISGYNHKAGVLLSKMCATIVQGLPNIQVDFFERIRSKVEKYYQSALVSPPYQQGSMTVDLMLEANNKGSLQKRLEYLSNKKLLQRDDLLSFSKQLLSQFQLEMLVHGNVPVEDAKSWANIILDAFQPSPPLRLLTSRAVQIPPDSVYQSKGWNQEEENSCIVNVYQVGPVDVRTNAVLSVAMQLLREPAFNVLRTGEQLGYIVFTNVKTVADTCKNVMILIQSDSYDPIHMDQRIECFLSTVRKQLYEMSTKDFEHNVDSLCQTLLEKSKNLGEESSKHWAVISNRSYRFKKFQDIAAAARTLSMSDVLQFFDRFLSAESPHRRKLSVQLFGKAHEGVLFESMGSLDNSKTEVSILDDFVIEQPLFAGQGPVSMADFV